MKFYDAHNHLHDTRLSGVEFYGEDWNVQGTLGAVIINGTCEEDWSEVQLLCGQEPRYFPAYGVHPWKAASATEDWEETLREYLSQEAVSLGEIGLDRWIEDTDYEKQESIFRRQLSLALEFEITPTVHCLKAWGWLLDVLDSMWPVGKPFLLHGYGGSLELVPKLVSLGAYFSFSAYIGGSKRRKARESAAGIPGDRLLVETDAPDMAPPEGIGQYLIQDMKGGRLHHPNEIVSAYRLLAEIRNESWDDLASRTEENFFRCFPAAIT